MNKTQDERDWHLAQFARGGWQAHRYNGIKKWETHLVRHLKNHHLEQDDDLPGLFRITDKGIRHVLDTKYAHFVPPSMKDGS